MACGLTLQESRHESGQMPVPKPVYFGVTNPTQLLEKLDLLGEWDLDVVSLSETSHTVRSVAALHGQARRAGSNLSLSDPVPDKGELQVSSAVRTGDTDGGIDV